MPEGGFTFGFNLFFSLLEMYLQSARSRERMALLLAKSKKLMAPAAAAAAAVPSAAEAEGEQTPAAEAQMSTGERLQVGEEYLRQLGTRPLAAALMDLEKMVAANQAGSADVALTGEQNEPWLTGHRVLRQGIAGAMSVTVR
jgi:hypothetical protein